MRKMSAISVDSWQEVVSSTSSTHSARDDSLDDDIAGNVDDNASDHPDCDKKKKSAVNVIVSSANVDGGGLWLCLWGGFMMGFVVSVWVLSVFTPLIAIGLLWHGGRYAFTALGGLIAVTVYPYIAGEDEVDVNVEVDRSHKGTGKPSEGHLTADRTTASWTTFRDAIPEWGQHWHRSCGRVYESEGPDSWNEMPATVFCYHPHGIFTQGYILNGSLNREMPKIAGLLASALYHAPIFRLVLGRWTGATAPASKEEFLKQMNKGRSFGIIPGGFQEAALVKLGTNRVWIKARKGFVKYALQYGYRLRPVFTFGESNTYWNIQGCWRLRLWLTSKNVPAVVPWGVWWCPLLPRRSRIMSVYGTPIELPKLEKPSQEEVNKWHSVYVEELSALYDRHKEAYAVNPHHKLEIW